MRKWPAQVGTVVANVDRELSLLKMTIDMTNADYLSFFLWNELEPRCQQRAAGSLELHRYALMILSSHALLVDEYTYADMLMHICCGCACTYEYMAVHMHVYV